MKINSLTLILSAALLFNCAFPLNAEAKFDWLKKTFRSVTQEKMDTLQNASLSDTKIADGLREALKVGINNAVETAGQQDGYFKNDTIKILMPEKLQTLEKGLRAIGMNGPMDEFVLSMNRAAEKAAPHARDIFLDTLFQMNFKDVQGLLNGGNTAATDFFKAKTYNTLVEEYGPIVSQSLDRYDVTKQYNSLISKYNAIPFSKKISVPSAEDYVISKSLNGLFQVLGNEEIKIRNHPQAQVTDLLKDVFGSLQK